MTIGLIITIISLTGMGTLTAATPVSAIAAWMGMRGIGFAYLPATTVGIKDLPESSVNQASAMNNISRQLSASCAKTT